MPFCEPETNAINLSLFLYLEGIKTSQHRGMFKDKTLRVSRHNASMALCRHTIHIPARMRVQKRIHPINLQLACVHASIDPSANTYIHGQTGGQTDVHPDAKRDSHCLFVTQVLNLVVYIEGSIDASGLGTVSLHRSPC